MICRTLTNRIALALASAIAASLLAGCLGTSPATRYYAFDSREFVAESDSSFIAAVGPFELPDYLNRPQIVIREQGAKLRVMKYERWAEPLGEAFTRQINAELNNQMRTGLFYQFPATTDISPDYRIRGRIYKFEASSDGTVILTLRWGMLDRDGAFTIGPLGSSFSATVDSTEDIEAVTATMSQLIEQFSQQIITELRTAGIE